MIPYAPAGEDRLGYYVECPICQHRARPLAISRTEDEITKSASRRYALHYGARHERKSNAS